MQIVYTDTKVV